MKNLRAIDYIFMLSFVVLLFGLIVLRSHISNLYTEIAELQRAELQYKQAEKEIYVALNNVRGEIGALMTSFNIGEENFAVRFVPVFVTTPKRRGGEQFPSVTKAWEKKDGTAAEAKR